MKQYFNNLSEGMNIYLKEISKTAPINSAEEVRLSDLIKQGDKKALDKLIKANLKFVVSVATNYRNQGVSFEDLVSVGNRGLLRAAKRFEGAKNFKFISYAVWWIRQSILSELADHSRTVKVPVNRIHEISKLSRAYQKMLRNKQGDIAIEELAKELNVDSQEITFLLGLCSRAVALDGLVSTGDSPLLDFFASPEEEDPLDVVSRKKIVEKLLEMLPTDRHRFIITKSFGLDGDPPQALNEIAKEIKPKKITRERVRQLRDASIEIIKKNLSKELIEKMIG